MGRKAAVRLAVLIVLFSSILSCWTSAEVIPVPLAEVMFGAYNPSMLKRTTASGRTVGELHTELRRNQSAAMMRSETLRLDGEERGFCFVSIGCWGGDIPHTPRQERVRDELLRMLEGGVSLSSDASHILPSSSSFSSFPVRFVMAAGDNFYPKGVDESTSLPFYTTFEYFYSLQRGTKSTTPLQQPISEMIPWIAAIGNHDAIKNSEAQVQYTYESVEKPLEFSKMWKSQLQEKLDEGAGDDFRNLLVYEEPMPTGRWYMPARHFVMQVSSDTVIVVLDAPELHRCAVYTARHIAGRATAGDSRDQYLNATKQDCEGAMSQKRDVESWLLAEYAHIPFKIVMSHYPIMGNGPHQNYPFLVDWLQPLLERSCAVLYINADNHYLQVSQSGLQFYANSGAGAGSNGKLHSPSNRKLWTHVHSQFHAIQGGFMVHCKLNRDDGEEFRNFVVGEDGIQQFSFQVDMDSLQQCRAGILIAPSEEHSSVSMTILQRALGAGFILLGVCLLLRVNLTGLVAYMRRTVFGSSQRKASFGHDTSTLTIHFLSGFVESNTLRFRPSKVAAGLLCLVGLVLLVS